MFFSKVQFFYGYILLVTWAETEIPLYGSRLPAPKISQAPSLSVHALTLSRPIK